VFQQFKLSANHRFYFFFKLSALRKITPNSTKIITNNQFCDRNASRRETPKKIINIVRFVYFGIFMIFLKINNYLVLFCFHKVNAIIAPDTTDEKRICDTLYGTLKTQYPIKPMTKIITNSRAKYCKNFFIKQSISNFGYIKRQLAREMGTISDN
jgi:hypothetical protein